MRILVNAIPLRGLLTGISRYVRQLYTEMEKLPGVTVHYFDGIRLKEKMPEQASPEKWSRLTKTVWKLPDPLVFLLRVITWLNYERRLRNVCLNHRFDLYHETTFFPAALRAVPQVQTIYDLSLIQYRSAHPRERIMYFDFFHKRRMSFAVHRIAISNFIKKEACAYFGLSQGEVTSIPLAAGDSFFKRPEAQSASILRKMNLPDEFLLSVGSLEPRKNLGLLIEALKKANSKEALVLTGWEAWGSKEWLDRLDGTELRGRVYVTGYVSDEALACLYSTATALVYPSIYEGFGLPVLEAMSCGCPVICSNASSLPEVTGDAAVLVDPSDAVALASAIDKMALAQDVRMIYSKKGLFRAQEFSWRKTAEKTLEVFVALSH